MHNFTVNFIKEMRSTCFCLLGRQTQKEIKVNMFLVSLGVRFGTVLGKKSKVCMNLILWPDNSDEGV